LTLRNANALLRPVGFEREKSPCENARVNPGTLFAFSSVGACAGVAAWAAVSPTSQLFGATLHHTPDASLIALTFDDGPNPACTPELLKLLERYRASATFFVVGRFARAYPELVRETADRGHDIGNHTETHANLTWLPAWRIAEELQACQESILRALGFERDAAPILLRPPFGYRGPQLGSAVRRVGLRGVAMWSLTCYDWKPQPAARLIERLRLVVERSEQSSAAARKRKSAHTGEPSLSSSANTERAKLSGDEERPLSAAGHTKKKSGHGGEIIVLHDGDARRSGADRRHVLTALEYWLPRWRDAGFEFVTMNPLAGARP
jgi:peptidoglycan/xylan/chitin deacetylase (PgdA/CDA1 family)